MIQKIKAASPIQDVIREYGVVLEPAGSRYKGLCPFHADHRPSLTVDPHFGSWKCWPCGAGGDVFTFLMQHERVSFPEALRLLAERSSIPYEHDGVTGTSISQLFDVCERAADHFHRNLPDKVRQYARSRGLTDDSIDRFRLGYDDGQFTDPLLEQAGLYSGKWRVTSKRLTFPITDVRGRTVGFGGRCGPGQNVAKYVNTVETPIFSKRRTLYGVPTASKSVVVVEGYLDVIRCHQHGATNVTATLGTSLTKEHLALLRRTASQIVLMFDGDQAGRRAADRAIELYLKYDVDLRICLLPTGDPCDFFDTNSLEEFQAIVESAPDPLEYAYQRVSEESDPTEAEDAVQFLARIASNVRDSVRVSKAVECLAKRLNVPVELVRRNIHRPVLLPKSTDHPDPIDLELLTIALNCPELEIDINSDDPKIDSLFNSMKLLRQDGIVPDFANLSPTLEPHLCSYAAGLLGGDDWDERYRQTMQQWKRREADREYERLNSLSSETEVSDLTKRYLSCYNGTHD